MIKYIIIIFMIFVQSNLFAKDETECENIKKISPKYYLCKAGKVGKNMGLNTDNPKEKKYIIDWFKKKNDN